MTECLHWEKSHLHLNNHRNHVGNLVKWGCLQSVDHHFPYSKCIFLITQMGDVLWWRTKPSLILSTPPAYPQWVCNPTSLSKNQMKTAPDIKEMLWSAGSWVCGEWKHDGRKRNWNQFIFCFKKLFSLCNYNEKDTSNVNLVTKCPEQTILPIVIIFLNCWKSLQTLFH